MVRSVPFTLFGVFSLILVIATGVFGWLEPASPLPDAIEAILRAIVIPLWLMRRLVVAAGGVIFGLSVDGFPAWYDIGTIPILLLPYVALDLLARTCRHRREEAPTHA